MVLGIRMVVLCAVLTGCAGSHSSGGERVHEPESRASLAGSFADDVAFLSQHTEVLELVSDDGQARVAVTPAYQARVMTSTEGGPSGKSHGYVHRAGVAKGTRTPHMTVLGGEDRFWLGPEGGQFGLYFPPGAAFDLEHWQVPAPIDWGPFALVARSDRDLTFQQTMALTNHAGTQFAVRVDRTIRLLDRAAIAGALGAELPAHVRAVAYQSENRITNLGTAPWRRETGLLSIWILGMYPPAPRTTVVIPYQPGELGKVVNDRYFGAIAATRLKLGEHALFFRGDGRERGKIGVPRPRARDVLGSYDPDGPVLTLVQYTLPSDARDYVNSMWEEQSEPYGGDVVNSYNDGPLGPGAPPLGPFYELETSSPAAALAPGASQLHVQRTLHLSGPEPALDGIARRVLGVSLAEARASLPE
jgi:hypothetical protein